MGLRANSVSLLSDSLDFLGDAANYLISLWVLTAALVVRARASLIKGATMLAFGIFVLGSTLYHWLQGQLPEHTEMGVVGIAALLANVGVAALLYAFKEGDSNVQSVWLCSRNDAIGNLAVIAAAVAVYYTQSQYPDLLVAFLMSALAIHAGVLIIQKARQELRVSAAK